MEIQSLSNFKINSQENDKTSKLFVKLNIHLKNQLIDHLNRFSEILFSDITNPNEKLDYIKYNNGIMSMINNLPIFINDQLIDDDKLTGNFKLIDDFKSDYGSNLNELKAIADKPTIKKEINILDRINQMIQSNLDDNFESPINSPINKHNKSVDSLFNCHGSASEKCIGTLLNQTKSFSIGKQIQKSSNNQVNDKIIRNLNKTHSIDKISLNLDKIGSKDEIITNLNKTHSTDKISLNLDKTDSKDTSDQIDSMNTDQIKTKSKKNIKHESSENQKKYSKQINTMLANVKKFDIKNDTIRNWFDKFEIIADEYNWTDEQCYDALNFFLDPVLITIAKNDNNDYVEAKKQLIELIGELIYSNDNLEVHLNKMFNIFDETKFTFYEKKYFLNAYSPIHNIYNELKNLKTIESKKLISLLKQFL